MRRRSRSPTSKDQLRQLVLFRSFGPFRIAPFPGSFALLSRGGSDGAVNNSRACATASFRLYNRSLSPYPSLFIKVKN